MPRLNAAEIVEGASSAVQPALNDPADVSEHFRGSWCPANADDILLTGDHRFQRGPS